MKCYLKTKFASFEVEISEKGVKNIEVVGRIESGGNHEVIDELKNYFNGEKIDFRNISLDYGDLSEFAIKVLKAMRGIPYGKTRSYKWLAKRSGKPKGARAVGQIVKKNPHMIIAPCHRVIASDGSICGFACGIELKKKLLNLEGIDL